MEYPMPLRYPIYVAGFAHLFFAILRCISYCIAYVPVIIATRVDEDYQRSTSRGKRTCDRFIALFRTGRFDYELAHVVFSALGATVSPLWFTPHMLDLGVRNRLLAYILKSVTGNLRNLGIALFFGIVVIYLYAVIGFYFFQGQYEFGMGEKFECTSLYGCIRDFIDYGFRGPPVWYEPTNFSQFIFDSTYYIFVIVILLAIISGIIIDSFAAQRESKQEIEDNQNNTCFICGKTRDVIDRHGNGFQRHIQQDHNMWNYVYFHMYLEEKSPTDYTGQESYIRKQIDAFKIGYFPVDRCISVEQAIGRVKDEE
uniref:Ion transport domain-containing protein n=1 Tax=Palpitomonas bilix TaxID=652834 RepID=A0A7S3GF30_9EUKA